MIKKILSATAVLGLVFLMSSSCNKFESPLTSYETLTHRNIDKLYVSDDNLWIFSSNPTYSTSRPTIVDIQVSCLNLRTNKFLMNDSIPSTVSSAIDKRKKVFLATYDERILFLNDDISYLQYLHVPETGRVNSILFDQANILWIGTGDKGLFRFNGSDKNTFNTSNSILNSNNTEFIATDSESNIWLIQNDDLFKIDKNNKITKQTNIFPFKNNSVAYCLSSDKNNTLWTIKWDNFNHRIFRKSKNSEWTDVNPPSSSKERPVKFLKADNSGRIWIAYSNYPKDLLAYFDSGIWNEIQISRDKVVILDVETYENEILIGTSEGIYKTSLK